MSLRARGVLFFFAALLSLGAQIAHASDDYQPYDEFGKHVRAAQEVAPLTSNSFGDEINLYNGSTEFHATDISLPGNSALRVSLGRRYTIDDRRADPGYLGGFGEWDLDIPYIEAVVTQQDGWTVGNGSLNRCTDTTDALDTQVPGVVGNVTATLENVWDGDQLHIPGMADQELLANDQTSSPAYDSSHYHHWVTKDNWRIKCLPNTANGYPGESFVAESPSGVFYTLNWVVVNTAPTMHVMDETYNGAPVHIFAPRWRIYMLATQVKDRFGNTVDYTYDGTHLTKIASSGGRTITLTWSGDNIVSASDGTHTWSYSYGPDVNGRTTLTSVTLPDQSKWVYTNVTGSLVTKRDPICSQCQGDGDPPPPTHCQLTPYSNLGAFTYSITAPSGAKATYDFEYDRHFKEGVPKSCPDGNPDDEYPAVFSFFDNFTILQKEISGPGLPKDSSGNTKLIWMYDTGGSYNDETGWAPYVQEGAPYDPNGIYEPDGLCSNAGVGGTLYNREIIGPTSKTYYLYGTTYGCDEGRLYATQVTDLAGHVLKTTQLNYVSERAASNEPFSNIAGSSLLPSYVHPTSNRNRPVILTQITQDGATFSTTVNSFDAFARTTSQTGTGSKTKTLSTSYTDDINDWVLGLVTSTAVNGISASSTTYGSLDLPTSSYAFGKLISTKAWNPDGTLASVTDGDGNKTTLSGWKRGLPQAVGYADGTGVAAVINDDGTVASVTDENGYTTTYGYDSMGRLASIQYPGESGFNWNSTNITFAPVNGTEYGIDPAHWKQTIQTGNAITNTYFDALWRPLVTESYDSANNSGTLSQVVKQYDAGGRAVFTSYPINSLAIDSPWTSANTGTHTAYDALDRPIEVDQDSEQGTLKTTTQYTNFQTKITDPNGNVTTTSYDTYGAPDTSQPSQVTLPEGAVTTVTRDVFGKPVYIARNGTGYEFFVYDANQQLCKRSSMGIVSFYAYDNAGNLSWSASGLNENGNNTCSDVTQAVAGTRLVQRAYDARNRLTDLTFSDGNGNQHWTYTPDGLPSGVVTDNADTPPVTNAYVYDSRRLMTGESVSIPGQFTWGLGYGYDANGHLITRYTPSGQTYTYMPDALGRPTQLYIPNVNIYVNSVDYYPDGHISSFVWKNGLTHSVTENARGLPYEIHDHATGNEIEDLTYTYDPDGNPLQISDRIGTGPRSATLAYDGLNRLKTATLTASGPTATSYSYNALDQITQVAQGAHTVSFAYRTEYGRPDELETITDSQTGTTTYSYDPQGNLATRNGVQYQFDYGNRLRNVIGQEGSYAYDAYGRRIQQVNTSGVINSFYDHTGQLVFQRTADGTTHDYLYLGGHLVAIRDYDTGGIARTMRYQHTDAEGSIIRQTDANANPIAGDDYVYDPFGKQISGSAHDGPGYTGHVMDASTGLTYMQQRYYDPAAMRFLSMDPVEANNAGGNLDRYWYANDNPYRFTDPDGRDSRWWPSSGGGHSGSSCGEPLPSPTCQPQPQFATGGQPSSAQQSRPAGQCDLPECDQYRQQRDDIVQEQRAAVHAASKEFAKQAGWMAVNVIGERVLGKVLGGISKFLGFASEDAGVAFRADASHIFRNAPGHLAEDTAENRALLQGAVKPDNLIGTRGPGGSISVYQKTLSDGRQVWVEVRNGAEITNGGVNDVQQ